MVLWFPNSLPGLEFLLGGDSWSIYRQVNQWLGQLKRVNEFESTYREFTESQIRKEYLSLRYRAKSGEPLSALLPATFALTREAGQRALRMRHYDVQIVGATALFHVVSLKCRQGKERTNSNATVNPSQFGWKRSALGNRKRLPCEA